MTYRPVVRIARSGRRRPRLAVLLAAAAVVATLPAVLGRAAADGADRVVAVYGDTYSAGGRQGGRGSTGWPAIVADRLGADLRLRDAVAAAAGSAGLDFVDPLAGGWLRDRPDLIGADGVHPHDGGHAHLADLIEPAIEAALDAAPSPAR